MVVDRIALSVCRDPGVQDAGSRRRRCRLEWIALVVAMTLGACMIDAPRFTGAPTDAPMTDAPVADAGTDANDVDAPFDAAIDAPLDAAVDAPLDAPVITHTVTVARTGGGSGAITATPGGLLCPGACALTVVDGSVVTLDTSADAASVFAGWSGGGCGASGPCAITIDDDVVVLARFELRRYPLAVTVEATNGATGSVTSTPAGVACGTTCSAEFDHGTTVTLTAQPGPGAQLVGWSGAGAGCGAAPDCVVTVTAATAITATFTRPLLTLTAARTGDGVGTITSSPAGIACGTDCSESYPPGTIVTLTATAAATPAAQDSSFVGWSGGGCSGTAPCTLTLVAAAGVTANFALDPNLVFVTSTASTGNLGGIAGADALCQGRAAAAGLVGTYRAWLSTSTTSALARIGTASGWIRRDGKPFARTQADLLAGRHLYPVRLTETGADVGVSDFFQSTNASGALSGGTCGDWTLADSSSVRTGRTSGVGSLFSQGSSTTCAATLRVVCFGIDRAAVVAPLPTVAARRAFLSSTTFSPWSGLAAADALCASDATTAGLPGTFRALLATSGATALARFSTSSPWARVDHAVVTPTAVALGTASLWDAPINLQANGTTYHGNTGVWSGAPRVDVAGTAATTCNNWSSNSVLSVIGRAGETNAVEAFGGLTVSCVSPMHVYCLQQ